MCGLFGYSGWDKANVAKLKILGLFNQNRGRDSTGYYFNGRLVKGVDKAKKWEDFIQQDVIDEKAGDCKLFIGHTRWSTVGLNTEANAHPFNVNDKLIIAHNGTIENIWTLCTEYGVPSTNINVDSLALGHLLDKEGVKILEKYRGYAALLMHRLSEPDSLYVYHGASKLEESDKDMTEERPMFYMETREGVYFSSLEESLLAIRDVASQEPIQLVHNTVFKVTKGKFAKKNPYVYRTMNNINLEKKNTYTKTYGTGGNQSTYPTTKTGKTEQSTFKYLPAPAANSGFGTALLPSIKSNNIDIWKETLPTKCFDDSVSIEYDYIYYWQGRHWSMDKNRMLHGEIYCDKKGVIYENKGRKVFERYFYNGVILKSKNDWSNVMSEILSKSEIGIALSDTINHNFAKAISKYSMYPVTNLQSEAVKEDIYLQKCWWHKGTCVAGSQTPLWSDRSYVWKSGNLNEIQSKVKGDVVIIPSGGTKYQNQNIKAKTAVSKDGFENAEIIEYSTKPETFSMVVTNLGKYFDKIYKNEQEVEDNVPCTVLLSIRYICREMCEKDGYAPTDHQLDQYVKDFITTAIEDKIPFRDHMQSDLPCVEAYLKQAYLDEIAQEEEDEEEDKKEGEGTTLILDAAINEELKKKAEETKMENAIMEQF